MNAQPKWLPLRTWAKLNYGDAMPCINTLLKWVHDGRIQPQPEKHGKSWRVKAIAEYR